jgi:hypothetical protein
VRLLGGVEIKRRVDDIRDEILNLNPSSRLFSLFSSYLFSAYHQTLLISEARFDPPANKRTSSMSAQNNSVDPSAMNYFQFKGTCRISMTSVPYSVIPLSHSLNFIAQLMVVSRRKREGCDKRVWI